MKNRPFLLPMLGMGLFTLFLAPGCAHTPVKKEFGSWQKSTVGKYLSLQTPGNLKAADVALSDELKLKIDSIKTCNLDSGDSDNYLCLVNFFTFNSKITANLDGAADNVVNQMQKDPTLSDFKANRQYIQLGKQRESAWMGPSIPRARPARSMRSFSSIRTFYGR